MQPQVARVERDGAVLELPVSELAVGDLLHLRPGERVDEHVEGDERVVLRLSDPVGALAGPRMQAAGTIKDDDTYEQLSPDRRIAAIKQKAGEEDKLFGSVTARDIAAALSSADLEVDHKQIVLDEPIKQLGEYDVKVRLHRDVEAPIKVRVVAAS